MGRRESGPEFHINFDRTKYYQILLHFSTTKSCAKMGRRESGPEFHINFGRIGLGHFTCKSAWIGSRQLDLRPVLATTIRYSI